MVVRIPALHDSVLASKIVAFYSLAPYLRIIEVFLSATVLYFESVS